MEKNSIAKTTTKIMLADQGRNWQWKWKPDKTEYESLISLRSLLLGVAAGTVCDTEINISQLRLIIMN